MSEQKKAAPPSGKFTKKEKKTKLAPDALSDIMLAQKAGIKECTVFYVRSSNGQARQLTLHRKIGVVPGTFDDDWIVSDSADIPSLLARTEDPAARGAKLAIKNFMYESIAKAHPELLIIINADGKAVLGFPGDTQSRELRSREAKDLARKEKGTEYVKAHPDAYISYLKEGFREVEKKIQVLMQDKELIKIAEARVPKSDFATKGGPRADRPQVKIAGARGLPLSTVTDRLVKCITDGKLEKPAEVPKLAAIREDEIKILKSSADLNADLLEKAMSSEDPGAKTKGLTPASGALNPRKKGAAWGGP